MFKRIFLPVILFIALILASIFIVITYDVNGVMRHRLESKMSQALSVKVTAEKLDINIIKGEVIVRDLKIHNPEHYQHYPYLTQIPELYISLDILSIFNDTLEIKHILINEMPIYLDFGLNNNNFQQLLSNLQENMGLLSSEEHHDKRDLYKNLVIESFMIKTANITTRVSMLEGMIILHDLHFTNLGKGNQYNAAQLLSMVLEQIYDKVIIECVKHPNINIHTTLENLKNTFKQSIGR